MSDSSVSLVHIVQRPRVEPAGQAPLLVLLHGVGSNEEDLIALAPYLDPRFLVVSLRAPLTLGPGAYGWYQVEWAASGIRHDEAGAIAGQAAAEQAIDELVKPYDVDPSRVYLMGFSQGAILSLRIALTHPEKIAGAVIMSGRLLPVAADNGEAPAALTDLPIFVVHGTLDTILPISSGRQINEYLKKTPVSLTYKEYAMGHTVSQESLDDIAHWLTDSLNSSPPVKTP